MEKIAVCLYGKLDGSYINWTQKIVHNKWKHTSDKIKENIIDCNECDVYFHAFADNIEKEETLIVNKYNPVKYKIENDIDFSHIYKKHKDYTKLNKHRFWENRWAAEHTMVESINMCLNSDKKYDTIILSRFDYQPNEKYDISKLDVNILYIEDNTAKSLLKNGLAGDYMNIGPPHFIKCFADIYDKTFDFITFKRNSIHEEIMIELKKKGGIIYKNIIHLPFKGKVMKYPYNK